MKSVLEQIIDKQVDFAMEALKWRDGNKAAGRRARKMSLKLEKLHKQFRKESV